MSKASELLSLFEGKKITMWLSGDAMTNLKRDMLSDEGASDGDSLDVGGKKLGGSWIFKIDQKELNKFLDKNELETTLKKGHIALVEPDDFDDIWGRITSLK